MEEYPSDYTRIWSRLCSGWEISAALDLSLAQNRPLSFLLVWESEAGLGNSILKVEARVLLLLLLLLVFGQARNRLGCTRRVGDEGLLVNSLG